MSKIKIDEENLRELPSFMTRLKDAVISIFLGAIFAQVIGWTFGYGSIVIWYNTIPFIMYLTACGLIGAIVGEKFIQTLGLKSTDWFDLWNRWK